MTYRLLIDGELVEGAGSLDVVDPATGAVFERCARADAGQLDQAVAAAKRAFPGWSALGHDERAEYLQRFADAIEARFEEFCTLLTREQGKPTPQAEFEIGGTIAALRHFAGQDLPVEVVRETEEELILDQRMPLGVVAAIEAVGDAPGRPERLAMELPRHPADVEVGACPLRRQHDGGEARPDHAADDGTAGGSRGQHPAARRLQRHYRCE